MEAKAHRVISGQCPGIFNMSMAMFFIPLDKRVAAIHRQNGLHSNKRFRLATHMWLVLINAKKAYVLLINITVIFKLLLCFDGFLIRSAGLNWLVLIVNSIRSGFRLKRDGSPHNWIHAGHRLSFHH